MNEDIFRKENNKISDEAENHIFTIKTKAEELMKTYYKIIPGREKSLAYTNLEQSVMWAVKAVSEYKE
jgi:hypothetical protein